MNEFPSDPEPFGHSEGEGMPDQPDDGYNQPAAPDGMAAPDFYPSQDEELDATQQPDYSDIDPASFMVASEVVYPEINAEDLLSISEVTKQELMCMVLARTDDGMHLKEKREPVTHVIKVHECMSAELVSEDGKEEIRVSYFPKLKPDETSDPIMVRVAVLDVAAPLAAHGQTVYMVRQNAKGELNIDKHATLELPVDTPDTPEDETPHYYEALERFWRRFTDRPQEEAARSMGRELGTAFVSDAEARMLIAKLMAASDPYDW